MTRTRLLVASFIYLFVFSSQLLIPVANAQVPDPVVAAEAPRPGVGHHYIGNGAETVNPADGSPTFDLPLQPPTGRGLSAGFGIRYSGGEQFFLKGNIWNGSLAWTPNDSFGHMPFQVDGWSYELPTVTSTTSIFWQAYLPNNGCPGGVCTFSLNTCWGTDSYVFRGLDGSQYSLPIANVFPGLNNLQSNFCPGPPGNVRSPGNNHGILSNLQQSGPVTVVDHSGTTYQFPRGSGGGEPPNPPGNPSTGGNLATSITDRNGNQLTLTGNGNGYQLPATFWTSLET